MQRLVLNIRDETRNRMPWLSAGAAVVVILVIIVAAFALGLIPQLGTPIGKEIARHNHEGTTYLLVEYRDDLAIFTSSGVPVISRSRAQQVLRSYAWQQVLNDFDTYNLKDVSRRVDAVDERVSGVRRITNDVVDIFDHLDDIDADIPFLGRISALDVVGRAFPKVGETEKLIRTLNAELNDLHNNARTLSRASKNIANANPQSVSGNEMDKMFANTAKAAADLESTARSTKEKVSNATILVAGFRKALLSTSNTPIIGGAIEDTAQTVEGFESQLSDLHSMLKGLESDLSALGEDMNRAIASADKTHEADTKRWLEEPYDTEWPPDDPERQPD